MKNAYQTVLIAIDLDDKTLTRLDRSYPNLPHLANKVILLYVLDNEQLEKSDDDTLSHLVQERNDQLSILAKEMHKSTKLEVKAVLQTGKPAEEILKASISYGVDLIIMSTHTHPEDDYSQKNKLGDTVNKVVRQSKVPVLTFNSNVALRKIKKILLPLDLTAETRQKVTHAIQLAKSFKAEIHVVTVFWSSFSDIRNQLQAQMDQVKSFIEKEGIKVYEKLIYSDKGSKSLAPLVLEYADNIQADLIMIMTQQETRIEEFFMGSAAQTVLRNAKVPVMSIIPKQLSTIILGA